MKISVKTNLIEINLEDEVTLQQSYIKRDVPQMDVAIVAIVSEAIKLHNEVALSMKNNTDRSASVVVKKETV